MADYTINIKNSNDKRVFAAFGHGGAGADEGKWIPATKTDVETAIKAFVLERVRVYEVREVAEKKEKEVAKEEF